MATGYLSDGKVSEIRDRSSILEVVSDYVSLKKTGRNHKGLCPFHSEKTPSFMVNEEKQIFHCFGCGEGGDVFTFLMKAGHFSFPQAVEELAKRYGVSLPTRELSASQKREMDKRESLFEINRIASEYFRDLLTRRREGEEGRKYLSQRRISQEVAAEHGLGYSSDRWDGLVEYLREKKASLDLARELGLISPKKREGWYDAFRSRILFPIFDVHQRIVGFGGRMIKEGEPKYLNSPESSIYHKGEVLYGLQVAKRYATEKDCAIVVEGYFDLLTLHQYGWRHSVATLGTALTPQHIRTLKRYTRNLITLFDADQAGVQAALRSLPLFLEEEVAAKTVLLPKGEDPDGFLRKGNSEDFAKRVEEAVPLIDFFFERLTKTYDVRSVDGKVKIAKEGVALLSKIPDRIRRDFYTKALAERLDVKESFLHEMLRPVASPRGEPSAKEPTKEAESLAKSSAETTFPKSEEMVIRLMVHHPEVIPAISKQGILKDFESPSLQKIAEGLEKLYQRKGRLDLPEVLVSFEETLKGRLCEFAFQESGLEGGDRGKILQDCIQKIRERRLKKEKAALLRRIKEAEKEREGRRLVPLLKEHQELAKREKDLHKDGFRKG
ncbi:MAG TPA: DNA primase [Thermodesulfobacteriota bacterium]|nr:DNA primase [Thermodesulfobacteriota bacterium]